MRSWRVAILAGAIGVGVFAAPALAAGHGNGNGNGLIAFERDHAIYTAKPDGSSIERLTEGSPDAPDGEPAWSPDGTKLVYYEDCGVACNSFWWTTTGAGQRSPASYKYGEAASKIQWAPDGSDNFMYAATNATGPKLIFTQTIAAPSCPGGALNLALSGSLTSGAPETGSWSPDGTRVAALQSGIPFIYTIAMKESHNPFDACTGPDVIWRDAPTCPDYQQNHCDHTTLSGGNTIEWSPDGNRLAITTGTGLWVMNADGSGLQQIDKSSDDLDAVWSPDGTLIAFTRQDGSFTDIWTIHADGSGARLLIPDASGPAWQPVAPFKQCVIDQPTLTPLPLSQDEQIVVRNNQAMQTYEYQLSLVDSINNLVADARKHPSHFHADAARVATLKQIYSAARSLQMGRAAADLSDAERTVVREAGCGLMKNAVSSLKSYVEESKIGRKQQANELIDKVDEFGKVLTGQVPRDSGDATSVLKTNVVALIKQFAGADAAKYVEGADELRGKGSELFHVLNGSLNEDELKKTEEANITLLAKKIGGSQGQLLATQLLTFRKMLSGTASEGEQFEALKTAFVDLATQLVGRNIMQVPQVRAAMLGFQIGTALGNSIAANLKLIQTVALVRACSVALMLKQRNTKDVANFLDLDYNTPTVADVTKNESVAFDDSRCSIKTDGFREGAKGGVVEVLLPTYFLGFGWKNGYTTVYYDPTWTSQG